MFPPPPEAVSEDYSNFLFWRDPIPDIELFDPSLNSSARASERVAW